MKTLHKPNEERFQLFENNNYQFNDHDRDIAQKAWDTQEKHYTELRKATDVLVNSLEGLACWDEGKKVTSRFDDPSSATAAREALKQWYKLNNS